MYVTRFNTRHRCSCSRTNALHCTTNNAKNEPLKCSALNTFLNCDGCPSITTSKIIGFAAQSLWSCSMATQFVNTVKMIISTNSSPSLPSHRKWFCKALNYFYMEVVDYSISGISMDLRPVLRIGSNFQNRQHSTWTIAYFCGTHDTYHILAILRILC